MGATRPRARPGKVRETRRKHAVCSYLAMLDVARVTEKASQRVEVTRGVARVELDGELPLGWCGNLAGALSRRGVSILRGHAERRGTGWSVALEVASEHGTDPRELDFAALAHEASPEPQGPPRLESFVLDMPRRSAAVELTVRGPDRRGFLAALLDRLALLGLFPARISVETVHGTASDTLWLESTGGQAPTDASLHALRDFLHGAIAR